MEKMLAQILQELRGAARFRVQALIVAWIVCILGWAGVFLMKDQYEASTKIFVDTRTALAPVIAGLAIQQDVSAQLNYVQQSLLSSAQLTKIATKIDPSFSNGSQEARAAFIDKMQSHAEITVQAMGDHDRPTGGAIYAIKYQDEDRARSLKVVQALRDAFINTVVGGKEEGSEAAQAFLREQIADTEKRLRAAEQRLADFKKHNVGTMPGAGGDYFTRLQGEMEGVKLAQNQLSVMTSRREELARQLRGEAPLAGGGGAIGSKAANDTLARINEAQAKLDELMLRFTDKHPDVIALKETIAQLAERRQEEIKALSRGDMSAMLASGANANPVYQNIQLSLNQTDVEVAALRRQIADREAKIAELRRLVNTVPEVEAEFARLNRDYDVTRGQYGALADRLAKARLGQDAEASGAVRFEGIAPPSAGFQPVAPNRPKLILVVFFIAIALGGGLAYLQHQLKRAFDNPRMLHEVTGLPVLGVVSLAWLEKHRSLMRRKYVWNSVAIGLLVVVMLAVLQFNETLVHLIPEHHVG
jgi:polysaccharide chain length determinant protein (PEP-CTERM system associated)